MPSPDHGQSGGWAIQAWQDGTIVDWWSGYDDVLARDAARELFARGSDVELFHDVKFLGWVERADCSLARMVGELTHRGSSGARGELRSETGGGR